MRIAETVTFGGSGLMRAAELRGKPERQAELLAAGDTRVIPFWRGRPLVTGKARDMLGRVPVGHPVLAGSPASVFLGIDGDRAVFAADISHWEPVTAEPGAADVFFDPSEQIHPELPPDHVFTELRGLMTRLDTRDAELAATAKALLGWHRSHGFCAKCGAASVVELAGWQRTCPACGTHHFPRTDPVVIMLITRGNSVLLGRSPTWPEGMYSLLAGFIEPGETIEAAVRREVFEESGIEVGAVRYLASQPWAFPASLMIGCHGVATSETIIIDPVEIEHALWMSREDMVTVMAGEHPLVKPSRPGAIAHFLIANWLSDRLD